MQIFSLASTFTVAEMPPESLDDIDRDLLLSSGRSLLTAAARSNAQQGKELPPWLALLRQQQAQAADLLPALCADQQADGPQRSARGRWGPMLALRIQHALHFAFKCAAADGSASGRGVFRQRPIIEAVTLAMASGWRLAKVCSQTGTAVPKGYWVDVYNLYAYADAQGWEEKEPEEGEPSPQESYHRILLLGMTGSNRYEPDQARLLLSLVEELATDLKVEPLPRTIKRWTGAFVFHLHADSPPLYFSDPPDQGQQSGRMLGLARVAQRLMQRIEAMQNAVVAPSQRQLQLYLRVHKAWTQPAHRRHARNWSSSAERVELVSTLPACLTVVVQAGDEAQAGASWMGHYPIGAQEDAEGAATRAPASLAVSNLSLSGLMLQGDAKGHRMAVNELVVYRHAGKPWRAGLIRWSNLVLDPPIVQCGIENVGDAPQIVLARPITSQVEDRFMKTLRPHGRTVLIMPGRYFQPLRELLLADASGLSRVQLVDLLHQSAQYQVMQYKVIGPATLG